MKRRMTLLVFMPLMAILVFSLIKSTTALGEVVGDDNGLARRAGAVNTTAPGALILVAGHLYPNDPLQANIYHVTDTTYQLFRSRGYMDSDIFYLINDPVTGQDALPTLDNLHLAIAE